ncbi:MAG: tRNA (adenosine(37)-N6)-dimethylallyltransferase MiaA [Alphaproteobacteria bacterium]
MLQEKPSVILVAGPTASGKSALAADLAVETGGAVINADAMQVYHGLPILTAQPDPAALARAPHHLYAYVDPGERYSAGKWLAEAIKTIDAAWAGNKTPILVGGTGMYFKMLLSGLADIPEISDELRRQLRDDYEKDGEPVIRQRLAALDHDAAARIPPGDRQRLLRALEVALATGKSLSAWQQETQPGFLSGADITPILLMPPRDELYAACERRFSGMLERGAIEEVRALPALDPGLPAMKTIGAREIGDYLSGSIGLEEAKQSAQQATRNYAKRQVTWFRNQWLGGKSGFGRGVVLVEDFYRVEMLKKIIERGGFK